MFIIEGDVTIAEIDDALGYISIQLRTDKFGDRMQDCLDHCYERLEITLTKNQFNQLIKSN